MELIDLEMLHTNVQHMVCQGYGYQGVALKRVKEFLNKINSIFKLQKLTYTDGSLEEAFPREGSY